MKTAKPSTPNITQTEPVAVGGAILTVATAVIGVLNGFDIVQWTHTQTGLVLTLLSTLVATVTAIQRARVTPVAQPSVTVPLPTPQPPEGN